MEITSSFKLFHSAPEWLRGRGGNGLRCASASTWHFFPNGYNEALSSQPGKKGGEEGRNPFEVTEQKINRSTRPWQELTYKRRIAPREIEGRGDDSSRPTDSGRQAGRSCKCAVMYDSPFSHRPPRPPASHDCMTGHGATRSGCVSRHCQVLLGSLSPSFERARQNTMYKRIARGLDRHYLRRLLTEGKGRTSPSTRACGSTVKAWTLIGNCIYIAI